MTNLSFYDERRDPRAYARRKAARENRTTDDSLAPALPPALRDGINELDRIIKAKHGASRAVSATTLRWHNADEFVVLVRIDAKRSSQLHYLISDGAVVCPVGEDGAVQRYDLANHDDVVAFWGILRPAILELATGKP